MTLMVSKKKSRLSTIPLRQYFPNDTAAMMTLLAAAAPPLDWTAYCGLTPDKQLVWNERGDELNKPMLYLMNLKNEYAKNDLCLAYS